MPLEPYLLKSFWAGAMKMGWLGAVPRGRRLWPPVLLLPVAALAGAVIGDVAILATGMLQKRHEADRKSDAERRRLACEPGRRNDKERRHAAKWDCEKFYRLHAYDLKDRMSQELFDSLAPGSSATTSPWSSWRPTPASCWT